MQGESRVDVTGTAEAAAASYHARLESDPELCRATQEALYGAHVERGLMIGGRMLCNVMRPRFMEEATWDHVDRVSALLAGVLERAGRLLLDSDALMERVGASEEEREIWSVDPGYAGITLTSRLDSFMVEGRLRFIEYNAESPAGIGFCDCLTEVFEDLPLLRAWDGAPPQRADGRSQLLDVILGAYREWGGNGTPTMAVIDWKDVLTRRDFELCAEHFVESGVPTVICDPRDLVYRRGHVLLGDERIDLVYRRVLLHELLEKADEATDLLRAYRDGAICMVNSPRSKLLHKKTIFAGLSDGTLRVDLSKEEREAVDETIPWTRSVRPGRTEWNGGRVDLQQLLTDERERFVLKPADDYGGRGVVLGWETPAEEWQRTIETASEAGYIVQERVDVAQEAFPAMRDGELRYEPLLMDTNPLLFNGRMGAVLTRLSGSALLNVTAGTGSTTPTFVLRKE